MRRTDIIKRARSAMIGVALLSSFTSVADAATLFAPGTLTWGIYGTHIYRINTAKVDTTCSGCGTYNGSTYAGFTNDYFNNNKTYVTTLDYPVGSGIASNGAPTLIPSGAVRMFSFTSYTAINSGDTLATLWRPTSPGISPQLSTTTTRRGRKRPAPNKQIQHIMNSSSRRSRQTTIWSR